MTLEMTHGGDRETALASIQQGTCSYCGGDALTRERYKGNDAIVCGDCDTPAAQFW
jgi:hypothetical protein